MKTAFLLFVILFNLAAHAEDELNFNYKKVPVTLEQKADFLKGLNKTLDARGLEAAGLNGPFLVDEIYGTEFFEKAVFVKFGYEADDSTVNNKILTLDDGLLYHSKTKDGVPFALMIQGFDLQVAQSILNDLKYTVMKENISPRVYRYSFLETLIPSAHAQEECEPGDQESFSSRVISQFDRFLTHDFLGFTSNISNRPVRCLVGVFRGYWDVTGGAAGTIVRGAVHTVMAPLQSARKVWNAARNFASGIRNFIRDSRGMVERSFRFLNSLPPERQAEVYCRLAGLVGASAISIYLTGGALAGVGLQRMHDHLKNLEREERTRRR